MPWEEESDPPVHSFYRTPACYCAWFPIFCGGVVYSAGILVWIIGLDREVPQVPQVRLARGVLRVQRLRMFSFWVLDFLSSPAPLGGIFSNLGDQDVH